MKVHCVNPEHSDQTPSMHVYPEFSHCFVCGFRISTSEIFNAEEITRIEKEPEDVAEKITYIKSLPKRSIRGLEFHAEESGFYIVWPDESYYKLRRYDSKPRYIGPRGHRAPPFVLEGSSDILVVVEGEINALSLLKVYEEDSGDSKSHPTIISSGSVNEIHRHIKRYIQFKTVYILVDKDQPGVYNGLMLKQSLERYGKHVVLLALENDLNELLQKGGTDEIRRVLKRELNEGSQVEGT